MSLIIDALKKAQQLRLKGSEVSPILKYPHPDKKRGRSSKKQWVLSGAGLHSLCILLFVFLKPASPPLAIQTNRVMVSMERKPSVPVEEKISPEPPKEVTDLTKVKDPTEGLPYVGAAYISSHSHPKGKNISPETKPSLNEKEVESLIGQVPEEEKIKLREKMGQKKSLPSLPPAAQKEEPPP